MSSANLDLVRSIRAALDRGDYRSAEWADPEIENVFVDGPSPGSCRGLTSMAEAMRDFLSAWENFRTETLEYIELDSDRVLVITRYHGRGKKSGLEVERIRAKGASIFHLRDGRVTKLVQYFDGDRALADLGLAV